MGKVLYTVNYGVPFNIQKKTFDSESKARDFIKSHVFGDSRYCSLVKSEVLDGEFEIVSHYAGNDNTIRKALFDDGIVSKDLYELSLDDSGVPGSVYAKALDKIAKGVSVREAIANVSLNESASPIKYAFAVYTGGNIWLFYGQLKNGNYFLTDDYGATLYLDADPSDLDESTYTEWQDEHKIKELFGKERLDFCDALIAYLLKADSMHRGGITDSELKGYKDYFKEEW